MTDSGNRLERVIEELTGNESLLEMLDTEAATEMLNWGIATSKSIVSKTQDLDDFTADLAILPRLKAIRQSMRSIGNWAAGKYADAASRVQLRDKLLQNFKVIFGEDSQLPSAEKMDAVLNQVDDKTNTPNQLILKLTQLLTEAS
jgi:Tfp pilus assembly protein PilO